MCEIQVFLNRIFSGSFWPLIIFNILFYLDQCDTRDPEQSSKLKSDKIY
jgi:hypothetical protein